MAPKEHLENLENEGLWVFHGSGENLSVLEPRQAMNFDIGGGSPDGNPAVFASSKVAYAIFMALINEQNCPQGFRSGSGTHNGVLTFRATQETLNQLNDSSRGFVYVCKKEDFTLRDEGGVEYVRFSKIIPTIVIEVSRLDLPKEIEII